MNQLPSNTFATAGHKGNSYEVVVELPRSIAGTYPGMGLKERGVAQALAKRRLSFPQWNQAH